MPLTNEDIKERKYTAKAPLRERERERDGGGGETLLDRLCNLDDSVKSDKVLWQHSSSLPRFCFQRQQSNALASIHDEEGKTKEKPPRVLLKYKTLL